MTKLPTSNLINVERVKRKLHTAPPSSAEKRPNSVNDSAVNSMELEALLKSTITGEVRFDNGSRALYATDASNYRQVPIGVVVPRTVEDVVATVAACRKFGAPVLSRGGGTSLAGQCCNVAVVIDWSKYLGSVLEIDMKRMLGRVQPGCVLDNLRDDAAKYQITFGPDPATHTHNTLGGMIGNDSCGTHSVMAELAGNGSRTADNIDSMDVLLYDGTRLTVGKTSEEELEQIIAAGGRRGDIYRRMRELRDKYADLIRAKFPQIPRRVSGYTLEYLLPENGFNVAAALVGSEGTLVTVLEASCKLIPLPKARSLVVLGFPDVFAAGDAGPKIMEHKPIALEGFDQTLVNWMDKKQLNTKDLSLLPSGTGFLLCEFGGDTKEEADSKARELIERFESHDPKPDTKLFDDPKKAQMVWEVRESALAASADIPGEPNMWPGWEDSAVPPDKMGPYLRRLSALLNKYQYKTSFYGHFGQGCIHCRISFDLVTQEGIDHWKQFLLEAAHLVVEFGGSLSGEHGDGQARAQLLPIMFGDELIEAMREFKRIWDPDGMMNPGKVIDAYAVDENLRLGTHYNPLQSKTFFKYMDDGGSFADATLRCVGVGKCRKQNGGVMCPSYMATKEEAYTTRGRARLLFEMLEGSPLTDGWKDDAVYEALDLCLACKGCTAQCPVNVDMPTYKAEFRAHYFQGRLHPRGHYAFGFIHTWANWVSRVPLLAAALNIGAHTPGLSSAAKWLAGMDQSRRIPAFAPQPFTQWWANRQIRNQGMPKVVLFPDTFNNYFHPETAKAAVEVLEAAGRQVVVPRRDMCCGRPLYDYGFMAAAERWMTNVLDVMSDGIQAGLPVVFLEPSCCSTFKDEMMKLMPGHQNAARLLPLCHMLTEYLDQECPDFAKKYPLKRQALLHGHCHHKTVLDFESEKKTFEKMGLEINAPEDGCCGMAGAFGFESEHFEIAQKCADRALLPGIERQDAQTLVIANGFSCREMISQNSDRHAMHAAEILRMAIRDGSDGTPGEYPELRNIQPPDPSRSTRMILLALGGATLGIVLARWVLTRKRH